MQTLEMEIRYFPHEAQLPFHNDRYKVLHRAIIAGTGSGKTEAGVFEDISWCIDNPGIVGYVFEPSYPMVKRILIPKLEKFLGVPLETSPLIRNFNKSDLKLDWINDSTLWLGSLDNAESVEGSNVDFAHVDEARLVPDLETAIKVLQRRLRGSGGGHPIGAWWTTTPDSPGSVLHKFLEDPKTRNIKSRIYRMSIFDNKDHLPEQYVREVVAAHTGGLAERFVYGRFAAVAEGALGFDSTKHVVDVVERARISRWVYGVDFGWTNPAAILAVGLDGDGRAYVVDEFYKSMATDEELISAAKEFAASYGAGPLLCDPSEPQTIEKMRRAGLRAEGAKSKRDDGVRDIGSRLQLHGDRYRLYVHHRCVNLISELQSYDPTKKERDHAVDALRYALSVRLVGPPTSRRGRVW
jgi:phage terminase large subunit-like protein